MIYIKELRKPSKDQFDFYLSNGEILKYRKISSCSTYYYYLTTSTCNSKLFKELGIVDKNTFAEEILGYKCQGDWPEAKSEEDLLKLIDALCKYNNPKYTIKKDFIVEDYPVSPSEVISFYNADKTEVTFKELNVTYEIYILTNKVWWKPTIYSTHENFIFKSLKIKDKNKWVENIQGYNLKGGTGTYGFPESKTKEDAIKVMDALIAEYIKQFKPKTTIKTNSYGDSKIELRRKKADVRVGSCPAGSIVYGKRGKTSVRGGRVSYQTCVGY